MKKSNLGDLSTDINSDFTSDDLRLNYVDSQIDELVKNILVLQEIIEDCRNSTNLKPRERHYLRQVHSCLSKAYSILAYLEKWEDFK